MEGERSPPCPSQNPKAKFSVYQNPNFAAALTARSLQPSPSALLLISSSSFASAFSLIAITSKIFTKVLEAAIGLVFVVTLLALIRALSLLNTKNALIVAARSSSAASPLKKPKEQKSLLIERQLGLLGLKPKPSEAIGNGEGKVQCRFLLKASAAFKISQCLHLTSGRNRCHNIILL